MIDARVPTPNETERRRYVTDRHDGTDETTDDGSDSTHDGTDRAGGPDAACGTQGRENVPDGGESASLDEIESMADFERAFTNALDEVPGEFVDESRLVPGTGPLDAAVVLVGEAPGADEVETGAPFVGQAGARLDESLEAVGVDREDLYITNLVKVRPPDNRTPHVDEIAAWQPVLAAELERVSPAVVVPLGTTATSELLGTDEGITTVHGERFERNGRLVVPAFHPAAQLYDPSKAEALESDLRTAFDSV